MRLVQDRGALVSDDLPILLKSCLAKRFAGKGPEAVIHEFGIRVGRGQNELTPLA